MSSGGARVGAGRPAGTGDPVRKMLREENECAREARNRLIKQIAGTRGDPLFGLIQIALDDTTPVGVKVAAFRSVLPYIHAPVATEAHVQHTHLSLDADELRRQILDKMNAYAASRPPVTIDADAAPALPEPEPVTE
jgi:hypothetical protein